MSIQYNVEVQDFNEIMEELASLQRKAVRRWSYEHPGGEWRAKSGWPNMFEYVASDGSVLGTVRKTSPGPWLAETEVGRAYFNADGAKAAIRRVFQQLGIPESGVASDGNREEGGAR